MKRFITVLMSAMIALSMMPTMAFAAGTACEGGKTCGHVAAIGTTHYSTLKEAVDSVTDGTKTKIELLCDVSDGEGIKIPSGRDIEIDLGGFTYTVTKNLVGSSGTESQCFQLLKDSNNYIHNGTIVANNAGIGIVIQNYSNLKLEKVVLDGEAIRRPDAYTLSNNNGEITIGNGTVIKAAKTTGSFAMDVCWASAYQDGARVTINDGAVVEGKLQLGLWGQKTYGDGKSVLTVNGGDFKGAIELDPYTTETPEQVKKNVVIRGGSFKVDPSAYVAMGYIATENDGIWVVGEDPITNTGSGDNASTNVDASDNTTATESGKTETTIDSTLGDKIVENAKDNNAADVVIKAETEKGESTGSTVALPESTVQALAKDTEASVTIKTDSAEVSLDKAAVDAVAAQAGTDGEVKLVVETKEQNKNKVEIELKLVTSKGTVSDFQGGNVTVTVPVNEELAGKNLVCVYIDDNGKYIRMDGTLAADGKSFTFTTGHFSAYAILSEEEANEEINGQDISKASVSGIANKTYTGKAITQKLAVKAGDKTLVAGTDYTVSYSKNVNVGVASVKIVGKGKYEGTLTKTFKINPKGTSISKVTGQRKLVRVVWKKQLTKMKTSYVSGYQVQYSTSSKFTSGTSKYANAKFSKGRTTKTIRNLKAGKKYYVRVRTYKTVNGTKFYSSWSKTKSVKTK